jgi:hypothetical protein
MSVLVSVLQDLFRASFRYKTRRFGEVMVSVLTIGPKVRGIKPGMGNGFLRTIKIRSMPYLGA